MLFWRFLVVFEIRSDGFLVLVGFGVVFLNREELVGEKDYYVIV